LYRISCTISALEIR
jgi:hypothetical protein